MFMEYPVTVSRTVLRTFNILMPDDGQRYVL